MLTLYHLTNSRSQRMIWLLQELGVAYDLVFAERQADGTATEELARIHPLGKVPILIDSINGVILAESGAIVDYLALHYANHPLFACIQDPSYLYWKQFAESSLMPNLALKQLFYRLVMRTPWLVRPLTTMIKRAVDMHYLNAQIDQQLQLVNNTLAKQAFIAPQFSAADILLEFMLTAVLSAHPFSGVTYPHISRYLTQLHARPCYHEAVVKGQFDAATFAHYWARSW